MKRSTPIPSSMHGTAQGAGAGDHSRSFAIGLNQVDEDDRLVDGADGRSPGEEFIKRLDSVSGDKRTRTRDAFDYN